MEKFKFSDKDISNKNRACRGIDYITKYYSGISVRYVDGFVKIFTIDQWVRHKDGICANLFDKNLCKIKPIKKLKYLFKDV